MNQHQSHATARAGRRLDLEPVPPLREGEHYAGFIVRPDGSAAHHLILLPGDVDVPTWRQAEAFAAEAGGALPDLCELELLYLNLKDQFKPECYWSKEVTRFGGDDVDSMMYQSFENARYIDFAPDAEPMRARAIRRVPIEGPIAMTADGNG
jgi:hypothetical protein